MDNLHQKTNALESNNKKSSGLEAEIYQIKNREKDLQRIIDEGKAENDSLRMKLASGTSNEGSGSLGLWKPKLSAIR